MRNVKVHITREKQRGTKQHFITFGFKFQVSSNKFKTNACLMSHTAQKKRRMIAAIIIMILPSLWFYSNL